MANEGIHYVPEPEVFGGYTPSELGTIGKMAVELFAGGMVALPIAIERLQEGRPLAAGVLAVLTAVSCKLSYDAFLDLCDKTDPANQ